MIRLLIWGLLIYIGYRIVVSLAKPKGCRITPTQEHGDAATTYRDPVCGIYVSEEDAVIGRLDGTRHFFCSHDCLEKYRQNLDHIHHHKTTEEV